MVRIKNSFKDINKRQSITVMTVLFILATSVFIVTYNILKTNNTKELADILDREKRLFDYRVNQHKMTLFSLRSYIEDCLKKNVYISQDAVRNMMSSYLEAIPYAYNFYFALESEVARRYTNKDGLAFLLRKDKNSVMQLKPSEPQSFIQEKFDDPAYQKGIWYEVAQKSRGLSITPPYYDEEYMKLYMISVVTPIFDQNDVFAGMVGMDIPLELLALVDATRTTRNNYRVVYVTDQEEQFDKFYSSDFIKNKYPSFAVFDQDMKKAGFPVEGNFEFSAGNTDYEAFSFNPPGSQGFHVVVYRDVEYNLGMLYNVFYGLLCCFFVAIFIQLYLERRVSKHIANDVQILIKNFRSNTDAIQLNSEEFIPQKIEGLKISEFQVIGEMWNKFLINFQLSIVELKEERDKASKTLDLQQAFLANVSHEIRTPVNAIVGLADILKDTKLDIDQKEYVASLKSSSQSLLILINDILDLAKIEVGGMKIECHPMDLERFKTEVLSIFKHKAKTKNLDLNFYLDNAGHNFIVTDEIRLRQIVFNLVSNAIKFTASGKVEVSMTVDVEAQKLKIRVADTGRGIAPEKRSTIFEKFTQEDQTITRKFGGTGLGLAIVHSLVTMFEGEILLKTVLNQGSEFSVILPLELATEDQIAQVKRFTPGARDHRPQGKFKNVLVVDDVYENRLIMQLYLKGLGVKSITANDGEEAVQVFKRKNFDLILMDIQMPIKDGVTAMKEIREIIQKQNLNPIPIYALTAFSSREDQERYMREGFDSYIVKPVDENKITQIFGEKSDRG